MEETTNGPGASKPPAGGRWALYAALLILYLLHNDLWLWNDARLVFGLPVGLLYHVVFCLVTSVVLAMLVKWAWPSLEVPGDPPPRRERGGEWSPARHADPASEDSGE